MYVHMSYPDLQFVPQMLSPTAYEMGRYGKTPASHFYGLPNIAIPLTEVRAKGFTLPVTLSYNAGGNKPEQHPGWVGLGWSLNAGGSIIRVINGMKDEMSSMEYSAQTGMATAADPGYLYHMDEVQTDTDWDDAETLASKSLPYIEYEPDEYIINAPGIHASFYITGQNKIAIVSKDESSFELESFLIGDDSGVARLDIYPGKFSKPVMAFRYKYLRRFVIRDKHGNRYIFGGDDDAIEYSVVQRPPLAYNQTTQKNEYNTGIWNAAATANAWMLTRIERADGEIITFEYERNGVPIVLRDIHHGEIFVCDNISVLNTMKDTYSNMPDALKSNLQFHFLLPTYLRSIRCMLSGDELSFTTEDTNELEYGINREDFQKYVFWYHSSYNTIGNVSYEEFQSENRYRRLAAITGRCRDIRLEHTDDSTTRLKLNSVSIYNDGEKEQTYSFIYNDTPLPGYNSRKTDVWGYYNGIDYSDLLGQFGTGLSARRIAQEEPMKAEILTTIIYPTGGRTDFSYQPHMYAKKCLPMDFILMDCPSECIAGGLRIHTITDRTADGIPQVRTFEYAENGISSGILTAEGECRLEGRFEFNHELVSYAGDFVVYSELPLMPLSDTDGRHVTYSFVRERFPDGSYIDYKFTNSDDPDCRDKDPETEVGRLDKFPLYPSFTSRSLYRGLLKEKTTYRADGVAVMKECMTYGHVDTQVCKSVSQHRYVNNLIVFAAYVKHPCDYPALISKEVIRSMDDDTYLIDVQEYAYNNLRLPESVKQFRKVGENIETDSSTEVFYYPKDRTEDIFTLMQKAGMHGVTVGKATLRDGYVVQATESTYIDRDVDADMETTRTVYLPQKTFTSQLDTPKTLSTFQSSPMSYMKPCPDAHAKVWDSRGNVRFVGFRKGAGSEYHWSTRSSQPVLKVQSEDIPFNSVRKSHSIRIGYLSQEYSTNFKTIEVKPFEVSLYADYTYAWYIAVCIDGVTYCLTSWSIAEEPNTTWKERISKYPNNLRIDLPAGNHTLVIYKLDWKGNPSSQTETGGNITYSYYEEPVYQDLAQYVDLDVDTENGEGFHCEKGHIGPLTVSHPVVSGRNYVLDYMIKNGAQWQYIKTTYTGGNKTIGASGQTVCHVRIYPADSMPESYAWRDFTGMSARTDGHGVTESYVYDGLGRLSEVCDNNACKVKAHSYSFGDDSTIKTDVFTSADGTSARSTVRHYDGLGRLSQEVLIDGAGAGQDLVTLHQYDLMDREVKTWLPVPVASSSTRQPGALAGPDFAAPRPNDIYGGTAESIRYSLSVYEESPENRLLRKYGPGKSWTDADKAARNSLLSNGADQTQPTYHRGFSLTWSGSVLTIRRNGTYTYPGTYLVEKTEDEDGRCRYEFKNVRGETVLIRQEGGTSWHDTHYLYDSFGRLAAVIPPKLTEELEASTKTSWTEAEISGLAYLYRYDARGNCIAKLLPGGGWTYYVYDKGDRLVFSQDAVQRVNNLWTFRLEDLYGRECVKGTATIDIDVFDDSLGGVNVYVTMPDSPALSGLLKGYELTGFTLDSDVDVLNVNYHDGYGFLGSGPFPAATDAAAAYDSSAETEYGSRYTLSERGLATGSLVKVLDSSETELYLWKVIYYDDKGRPVQTREATHMGGVRKEYFAYDFVGNVTRRKTMQVSSTGTAVTVIQSYTYDAMGRPLTTTHRIGNGVQRTISSKAYDELGRLSADNRNGLASLRETRSYNLRSWLTNIDGQMFTEVLKYENSTIPQWGGNISVMQWGESAVQNAYSFIYDTHSRLQTANYSNSSSVGLYSEIYNYDLNGNMLRHVRGSQPLVMNYSGNRLTSAGNAAFEYDAKGRQVMSAYGSGLSTEYNILDLPQRQTTGEGTVVDYKYAFDGRKLQEKVTAGASVTQRDYSGEFLYEGGVLKKILFDGGYVINGESGPMYIFFLRDHLGSVRAVVSETGAVQQMNHYFPYGDLFPNTSNDDSGNRYKYTGKESGDEIGLYDFSARFLHTRFGRFTTIDPLAEKYSGISPYAYCNGNPVNFVDPDGRFYGDPVKNPEIRRNRASNLYGEGVRYSNGAFRNHQGFDYYAPIGTDILSVQDGVVVQVNENHKDYGTSVTIEHTTKDDNKVYSFYAHLSEVLVNVDDIVSEGDVIAKSGISGNASNLTGADQHLHFELRSKPENDKGLSGKLNPNDIVDTKFVSQYPEIKQQNVIGIIKVNRDGTMEIKDIFL